MKLKSRKLLTAVAAVALVFNLSLLSSAYEYHTKQEDPLVSTDNRTQVNYSYLLDAEGTIVYQKADKNNLQSSLSNRLPAGEVRTFYPGDAVVIPVLEPNSQPDGQPVSCAAKPVDSSITLTQQDSRIFSDASWYLGKNSSGENVWYILVSFQQSLFGTESYPVECSISLTNPLSGTSSNVITLTGNFENRSKQVYPNTVNVISEAVSVYAGADYTGEPIGFSFADSVTFRETQLYPSQKMYLNLDRSYDNDLANAVRCFDLQFYHFRGENQKFAAPGKLSLPAYGQEVYVYEVLPDSVQLLSTAYDDVSGMVSFATDTLGYYVVSKTELTLY